MSELENHPPTVFTAVESCAIEIACSIHNHTGVWICPVGRAGETVQGLQGLRLSRNNHAYHESNQNERESELGA